MNCVVICGLSGPFFSSMISSCVCQGYLRIAHRHVAGWSMLSSQLGACRWNDVCCVLYISWAISEGLVSITPCGFCMQSIQFSVVGWKFFLWIVLGLVFSRVLYFLMAVLMLIMVCLVVILYASILAFLPMVANVYIHLVCSVRLVGMGGMLMFNDDSSVIISGWFGSCV